jgi:2,3-bisphosphoglycerate-dependent phosphoglycerate mutase
VRHAEARATVDRVVGGPRGCKGLTDLGRDQAARLGDRMRSPGFPVPDVILASILPRAIETATILRDATGVSVGIERDCDYCELHPGDHDGMSIDESAHLNAERGPHDPMRPMSPGAESTFEFDRRTRRAMTAIIESSSGQTVLLVTHAGFIAAACLFMLGAPGLHVGRPALLEPDNVGITEFVRSSVTGPWTLERYNDCAHLEKDHIR